MHLSRLVVLFVWILALFLRVFAADRLRKQQQLYSRVQEIASLFKNESERELYQSVARDWRMPYWDWALRPSDGGPVYLEDFGEEMLNIYGPNGWQLISNPLYSYHFSTEEKLDFDFELVCPAFNGCATLTVLTL